MLARAGVSLRERTVEAYLRRRVRETGGIPYKFVSPGRKGVPDRLIAWPGNRLLFVEVKAPGKKLEPAQVREHKRLRVLGVAVYTADTKAAVDEIVDQYRKLL